MEAELEVEVKARRVSKLLEAAGVPFAVIGGNAVRAWVGTIDRKAARGTVDVNILLRKADIPAARAALEPGGFVYHETMDIPVFIDGPDGSARDAVHVIYACEKVRTDDTWPSVDVTDTERVGELRVLTLEALLRMKLISYRRKDQVHIQDMINIGLIDAAWPARFPPDLAARLQVLIDDPNG
ncbi:MAG: hypothetical protein ACRC33_09740 [Gemmataceae bacterium]